MGKPYKVEVGVARPKDASIVNLLKPNFMSGGFSKASFPTRFVKRGSSQ
jgi:hypothetical protein